MFIAVIGAGWSGAHMALQLTKEGHKVVLLDKQNNIFSGTSGKFGIRLHRGPHYPRSKMTRDNCAATFDRFRETYNELVVDHEVAVYANGTIDSQGFPSKVSDATFKDVCEETATCKQLDPAEYGFANMGNAFDLNEPSVAVGARVRSFFERELIKAGVSVMLGVEVKSIDRIYISDSRLPISAISFEFLSKGEKTGLPLSTNTVYVDKVISCTGFQSFVPQQIRSPAEPLHFQFVYQVCLALKFRDNAPTSNKPMSFIVMDGWFPCLMPSIDKELGEGQPQTDYILTHGAYTILASYPDPAKAHGLLASLTDEAVQEKIREPTEREMTRFWPKFSERFTYEGWYGSVLAKPACPTEFRSSFCFERNGLIHVFPGKISNVFDASDEVSVLLQATTESIPEVVENGIYKYMAGGVFDRGQAELRKAAGAHDRVTSNLQTFTATEKVEEKPAPVVATLPILASNPAPDVFVPKDVPSAALDLPLTANIAAPPAIMA